MTSVPKSLSARPHLMVAIDVPRDQKCLVHLIYITSILNLLFKVGIVREIDIKVFIYIQNFVKNNFILQLDFINECKNIKRCGEANENGCGCLQPNNIKKDSNGIGKICAEWKVKGEDGGESDGE